MILYLPVCKFFLMLLTICWNPGLAISAFTSLMSSRSPMVLTWSITSAMMGLFWNAAMAPVSPAAPRAGSSICAGLPSGNMTCSVLRMFSQKDSASGPGKLEKLSMARVRDSLPVLKSGEVSFLSARDWLATRKRLKCSTSLALSASEDILLRCLLLYVTIMG